MDENRKIDSLTRSVNDMVLTLLPQGKGNSPLAKEAVSYIFDGLCEMFAEGFEAFAVMSGTKEYRDRLVKVIEKACVQCEKEHKDEIDNYLELFKEKHDEEIQKEYFQSKRDPELAYRLHLLGAPYLLLVNKEEKVLITKLEPTLVEVEEEVKEEQPEAAEEEPKEEVKEEPKEEEKQPVEQVPQNNQTIINVYNTTINNAPAEEKKEEPKEEKPVEVVVLPIEAEEEEESKNDAVRKSFEQKLYEADDDLREKYYEIANEARAYRLKGRISFSADSYRYGRLTYMKITIVGKQLKIYYRLKPSDYDNTPIPHEDVRMIKAYEDIPMLFRVKSKLATKRAKDLIADMMGPLGIKREEVPEEERVGGVRSFGKFEVYPEDDEFKYRLRANNGEILCVSNGYASRDGAHNGIETLKKNIEVGVVSYITDKNDYTQWRLSTANDVRVIAYGELYTSQDSAERSWGSVTRFAQVETIIDLDKIPASERREWKLVLNKQEDKENGRIEIFMEEGSEKFKARLLASNGEILMLTANRYASKSSLKDAIENIRSKINEESLHILKDKAERYRFVLESGNGLLLALGETYASKESAKSAAESTLSFIHLAEIVDLTGKDDEGEAPKEEPKEEKPVAKEPAKVMETEEEEVVVDKTGRLVIVRKSFEQKLREADEGLRRRYEELKKEAEEAGLKGRVTFGADSYHISRETILKITIVGKQIKMYFRLNPKDYDETPIPHEDVSDIKAFEKLPMLFRVKSELAVKRAKRLLADLVAKESK